MSTKTADKIIHDVTTGLSIVLTHVSDVDRLKKAFTRDRIIHLLMGIGVTVLVVFLVGLPMRWLLWLLEHSIFVFSNKLGNTFMKMRESMKFWNIFYDAFWYIPLIVFFIYRKLHLFNYHDTFYQTICEKEARFGQSLENANEKQSMWSSLTHFAWHFARVLMINIFSYMLRLMPRARFFICVILILYIGFELILNKNNKHSHFSYNLENLKHVNSITIGLLSIILTGMIHSSLTEYVLFGLNFYLTTKSLSRELLLKYFIKVDFNNEEYDKARNRWLLFGFGTCIVALFSIPLIGLILYPILEESAAILCVEMFQRNKLSFKIGNIDHNNDNSSNDKPPLIKQDEISLTQRIKSQ